MKTKFISEIASSHKGRKKILEDLSIKHLKTKSNYLKYQIFKTKNLYPKNHKNFKRFKKIEINYKDWNKVINSFKNKTNLILEPFDEESLNFCKKFKKKVFIKLPTTECDNLKLVKTAIINFKKVFLNISGYKFETIKKIVDSKTVLKNKKKIILMYGFQSYPTKNSLLRFNLFDFFKKRGFKYGYADHSKHGINKNLIKSCKFAIFKKKCDYVEKHICENISTKPNDYISSIEVEDFDNFLKELVKSKKNIFFKHAKTRSKEEKKYAVNMQKYASVTKNINKHKILEFNNLKFLRSNIGKEGLLMIDMLGKKITAKINIKKGQFITEDMVIIK